MLPDAANPENTVQPAGGISTQTLERSAKYWFSDGEVTLQTKGPHGLFRVHEARFVNGIDDWNSSVLNQGQIDSGCRVVHLDDSAAEWHVMLDVIYGRNDQDALTDCDVVTLLLLESMFRKYHFKKLHNLAIQRIRSNLPGTLAEFNTIYEDHLRHIVLWKGYRPGCPCRKILCTPASLVQVVNHLVASDHVQRDGVNLDAALYLAAATLSPEEMTSGEVRDPSTGKLIAILSEAASTLVTNARRAIPESPEAFIPWLNPVADDPQLPPATHCTCVEELLAAQEEAELALLKNLIREYTNIVIALARHKSPMPYRTPGPFRNMPFCRFCRARQRERYEQGRNLFPSVA